MVDFLYHELDGDKEVAFRTHVDGCARCGQELQSLRRTRQALRALPESEPSSAVTARLLHEAAKRAPRLAAEEAGLWARLTSFFRPVVLHPAWAAAASLLLVAGVAGVLSMRGKVSSRAPLVSEGTKAADSPPAVETRNGYFADDRSAAAPAAPVGAAPTPVTTPVLDRTALAEEKDVARFADKPADKPAEAQAVRVGRPATVDEDATLRRRPEGKMRATERDDGLISNAGPKDMNQVDLPVTNAAAPPPAATGGELAKSPAPATPSVAPARTVPDGVVGGVENVRGQNKDKVDAKQVSQSAAAKNDKANDKASDLEAERVTQEQRHATQLATKKSAPVSQDEIARGRATQKPQAAPQPSPQQDPNQSAGQGVAGAPDSGRPKNVTTANADALKMPPPAEAKPGDGKEAKQQQGPSAVETLHAQARQKASGGNCTDALTIRRRIAKMDSEYYRRRVAGDQAFAACDGTDRKAPAPAKAAKERQAPADDEIDKAAK